MHFLQRIVNTCSFRFRCTNPEATVADLPEAVEANRRERLELQKKVYVHMIQHIDRQLAELDSEVI